MNPDPLYGALNFSHPQLSERLKALNFDPDDSRAEVDFEDDSANPPPPNIEDLRRVSSKENLIVKTHGSLNQDNEMYGELIEEGDGKDK